MKPLVFVTFVFFLNIIFPAKTLKINCLYKFKSWPVLGNSYTCKIVNLNHTLENQSILKVSGLQLPQMNNNNVRSVDISHQICHFLPQRLRNFFPNVELLQIKNSRLQVITQADLKPFPKLRVLHVNANLFTTLDNNLFESNQNLVRVDFKNQKLRLIGYNILDELFRLALADFESSGCVNVYAQNGKKGIEELKKEIRINCQPIEEMIKEINRLKLKVSVLEEANTIIEDKLKHADYEEDPAFKKLNAKIANIQQDKCSDNIETVTKSYLTLAQKFEVIESSLEMKLEVSKQNCAAEEIANGICLLEKDKLERYKRETSVIELKCEKADWTKVKSASNFRSCNVKNLKISQPDFEIKKVVSGLDLQEFNTEQIEELKSFNEQTIFLPLKIAENFQNLKVLSFVQCALIKITDEALIGLQKLQSLILTQNFIKNIDSKTFKDLSGLNLLDLSKNRIEALHDESLHSLTELTVLKLNNNKLYELSQNIFAKLSKLKFLLVNDNKLMVISVAVLDSIKKLEFADFSNNECVDIVLSKEAKITLKDFKITLEENCPTSNLLKIASN